MRPGVVRRGANGLGSSVREIEEELVGRNPGSPASRQYPLHERYGSVDPLDYAHLSREMHNGITYLYHLSADATNERRGDCRCYDDIRATHAPAPDASRQG